MSKIRRSPGTICVQGKNIQTSGSAVVPIAQTSTFVFENQEKMLAAIQAKYDKDVYTRWSNPTTRAVEEKISALEGTEDTHILSSGMAAISSAVMGLVKGGERVLSTEAIYGGTVHFFEEMLPQNGIDVDLVHHDNFVDAISDSQGKYSLCFFETPTNPTLTIVDIEKVADAARMVGLTSMIDSTFGTPINQNPHNMGIDIVMHSATKYLGGHSVLVAGTVSASRDNMQKVRSAAMLLGGTIDPFASFLLDRGIKTLVVRMDRHNSSAHYLADELLRDKRIRRVYYPGLSSHHNYAVAKKQMRGFGGMLTLELDADLEATKEFVDSLEIFLNAVSLGGVESLASIPALTTHYSVDEQTLSDAGISESTVRLSVGLEDPDDLLADLIASLDSSILL